MQIERETMPGYGGSNDKKRLSVSVHSPFSSETVSEREREGTAMNFCPALVAMPHTESCVTFMYTPISSKLSHAARYVLCSGKWEKVRSGLRICFVRST